MGDKVRARLNSNTKIEPSNGGATEEFSLISNAKLIALYENLLKYRMAARRRSGVLEEKAGKTLKRGHEAGIVGVAIDLRSEDAVCSPDGAWLSGVMERSPMDALLRPSSNGHQGTARTGSAKTKEKPTGVLPSNAHMAMGAALASKARKNGQITVVFANGDADESWSEALEIAGAHGLPIIFVKQESSGRNGRSAKRGTQAKNASSSESATFPRIPVDRNDVVAVHRVANEAIARARQGRGPTVIECRPFDVQTSNGAHAHGNGKTAPDAIATMEQYLRRKGLLDGRIKRDLVERFTKELDSI